MSASNGAFFQGTTSECLKHLASVTKNDKEKIRFIANFCGTGLITTEGWLKGAGFPRGEYLFKLKYYLEFLGYKVKELEYLDKEIRDAARVCAFGILTLSELAGFVGYSGTQRGEYNRGNSIDTLLTVLRGSHGVSVKKLQMFAKVAETYNLELSGVQHRTEKIHIASKVQNLHVESPEEVPVTLKKPFNHINLQTESDVHAAIIKSFAQSVLALTPLAKLLESDEFTAEERAQLRELSGGRGVFEFANSLYRLCGERSRREHSATSNQENGR